MHGTPELGASPFGWWHDFAGQKPGVSGIYFRLMPLATGLMLVHGVALFHGSMTFRKSGSVGPSRQK